jgi:hypothetical protein
MFVLFKIKTYFSFRDFLKNKIPMPVNECRYMFGCALESDLEADECFIQYQVVDDKGKPLKVPKFETVVGRVIVTKNPWCVLVFLFFS